MEAKLDGAKWWATVRSDCSLPSGHFICRVLNMPNRSLIALSLIMSLLQFKPAPMYILDEIDAALDLSHTQHIGQLFRTRFKGSQFIVVSLKEGLFTNANVLFRTRFRDGTSIVERTAQRSTSTLYGNEDKENEGDERRRRRTTGK